MKYIIAMLCFAVISVTQINAQNTSIIKTLLDNKQYVFVPQSITTNHGRNRQLDNSYFLKLKNDSLVVYLPYFGRAYSAPINTSDAGFDFTTTNFDYSVAAGKKNSYIVSVKTKDRTFNTEFTITVFDNGTAYLRTSSNDKEPVSFNGSVKEN